MKENCCFGEKNVFIYEYAGILSIPKDQDAAPPFGLEYGTSLHYFRSYLIDHAYATRERCNYASLLLFSLQLSIKCRLVLCNSAILFIRWSIASANTVAIRNFFQAGDIGRDEVTVERVMGVYAIPTD